MPARVLITGATGFLGSAILRHSARIFEKNAVRAMVRAHPAAALPDGVDAVTADLTDPATLRPACHGIETVIHAASSVGGGAELADRVNRVGTETLVETAVHCGVQRIIYLSTTAVYGSGPHRGAAEEELDPAPASSTSRARLAAENAVRAMGGLVIRPALVYGTGDRWFLPTLLRLSTTLDGVIKHGEARLSTVNVEDLATAVALLAGSENAITGGTVFHAAHPSPNSVATILATVAAGTGYAVPQRNVTLQEALDRAGELGLSEHQIRLTAEDHWYRADRLWEYTGHTPTPLTEGLPRSLKWYRDNLDERAR